MTGADAKHIGIMACSAEGASLCYRTICAEGPAMLGPHSARIEGRIDGVKVDRDFEGRRSDTTLVLWQGVETTTGGRAGALSGADQYDTLLNVDLVGAVLQL